MIHLFVEGLFALVGGGLVERGVLEQLPEPADVVSDFAL